MYAVVTAGGAYVPVDPDHPAERIGYVLESAEPVVVLTTTRDGFDAHRCDAVPVLDVDDAGSVGVLGCAGDRCGSGGAAACRTTRRM